jgi:hypothetical protein
MAILFGSGISIDGGIEIGGVERQASFTVAGTHTWVAPGGVTSVSVVCIGAGGSGSSSSYAGGGGGLGYKNNITVVPGTPYTVVVGAGHTPGNLAGNGVTGGDSYFIDATTVKGGGGQGGGLNGSSNALGGTYVGDGGGNGGTGGKRISGNGSGAGGGAGGYAGNGGAGAD